MRGPWRHGLGRGRVDHFPHNARLPIRRGGRTGRCLSDYTEYARGAGDLLLATLVVHDVRLMSPRTSNSGMAKRSEGVTHVEADAGPGRTARIDDV